MSELQNPTSNKNEKSTVQDKDMEHVKLHDMSPPKTKTFESCELGSEDNAPSEKRSVAPMTQ